MYTLICITVIEISHNEFIFKYLLDSSAVWDSAGLLKHLLEGFSLCCFFHFKDVKLSSKMFFLCM